MTTLSLEEAQARLPDLIHQLTPGSEVVITEKNLPVARLVMPQPEPTWPIPGRGKGTLTILSEDDEHLDDFKEYMP
jgi:antitoxin (DNA-binding transcriptional repressor) of toxin-antitoxin stability system